MKTLTTSQVLVDLKEGKPLKDSDNVDITIGLILCNVLSGRVSNPQLGYQLAKKFATEETVELKAEDIVFIKKELEASGLSALLIGQLIEILETGEK